MSFCISKNVYCQEASRPNIVFILADDLGYGDVKCFNPEGKIATPNLDKLASEGMAFTDAHASSSVCTPSRYSILTGRYPWRSRLQNGVLLGYSSPLIDSGRMTVASFLRQNGYYTAALGKWHLGMGWPLKPGYSKITTGWEVDYSEPIKQGPTTNGFDYFYGISGSLNMPPFAFIENNHTVGIPSVSKMFVQMWGPATKDFDAVNVVPVITRQTQKVIREQAAVKRSFFIYLALPSHISPLFPINNSWEKAV